MDHYSGNAYFVALPISAGTMQRCLEQVELSARRPLLLLSLLCSMERAGVFHVSYDKARYRRGTMLSFQKSPGSAFNFLVAVYVSGCCEENVHHLLVFYIGIRALHLVIFFW